MDGKENLDLSLPPELNMLRICLSRKKLSIQINLVGLVIIVVLNCRDFRYSEGDTVYSSSLSRFQEGSYVEQFTKFWRYFEGTWCKKYEPNDWNISDLLKKDNLEEIIVGR